MQLHKRLVIGWLLNLLLPGLGHFYWKEYAFGLFVYLVMLLASVLFVVSLFVTLPVAAAWLILGLPVIFYLFTFLDLTRTRQRKLVSVNRSTKAAAIIIVVGLAHQFLAPNALFNFAYRNRPEVYRMPHNQMNPLFATGDLLAADRLAYFVDIAFVNRPILRRLPERFDVVRFEDAPGRRRTGFVVGLPQEEVVIIEGLVVADGIPDPRDGPGGISLSGDWPLTQAGPYSILVGTVALGSLDQVYEVPLTGLIGKVDKLF
jgi:hypothetical protein